MATAAPSLTLHYFNGKGRGETSRMLMAHAGIAYKDQRYEFKDWAAVKSSMPFARLPVLEINGFKLAESGAMERYLARLGNLYGSTPLESAQVDMIFEVIGEVVTKYVEIVFGIKDEAEKKTKLESFFSTDLKKWNDFLTPLLEGKDYFVGKSATVADIKFYTGYSALLAKDANCLKDYKALTALHERVGNLPKIAEWIKKRPVTEW